MKIKDLKYWLKPVDSIFDDFAAYTLDGDNIKRRRVFIDNGFSDVLFVAHLDTVLPPKLYGAKRRRGKIKRIYAQGLDDRLGAMIAYNLSQELGADLLLTDHEESMQTTAEFHDCKDYNWIAEFDRMGGDVVTYELECKEWIAALEQYWAIGHGSYSDVCSLTSEACCVNIGIGYQNAHSKDSYVDIGTLTAQIAKFREFYAQYSGEKFKRDEIYASRGYNSWRSGYWTEFCDICGGYGGEEIHGYMLCEDCLKRLIERAAADEESYDGNAYNAYM